MDAVYTLPVYTTGCDSEVAIARQTAEGNAAMFGGMGGVHRGGGIRVPRLSPGGARCIGAAGLAAVQVALDLSFFAGVGLAGRAAMFAWISAGGGGAALARGTAAAAGSAYLPGRLSAGATDMIGLGISGISQAPGLRAEAITTVSATVTEYYAVDVNAALAAEGAGISNLSWRDFVPGFAATSAVEDAFNACR